MIKNLKYSTVAMLLLFIFALPTEMSAKVSKTKFKTSAVCGSCKKRIESTLTKMEGVQEAMLNLDNKVVTVRYDDEKLSEKDVKMAVVNLGYFADEMPKNEEAFKALPACCQSKKNSCAAKSQSSGCGSHDHGKDGHDH